MRLMWSLGRHDLQISEVGIGELQGQSSVLDDVLHDEGGGEFLDAAEGGELGVVAVLEGGQIGGNDAQHVVAFAKVLPINGLQRFFLDVGLTLSQGQGLTMVCMYNSALHTVETRIREQAVAFCEANHLPGFVAGVYHAGEQIVVAHGTANVATSAPMLEDTGFLFGSVTKVLTTTLVLQQLDRGLLDLDTPVVRHLPEFALTTPGAADRILVRHLLSHTNGIDADLFFPDAKGRDALKTYINGLAGSCGALFEPGEQLSYSNGGMIVAGRLLEVVTGMPFADLLERDIYGPAGMKDSSTSADQAILRSTAVGHFVDPVTMAAKPTGMFMLPDTWGPAGGTPIGTASDLLTFGCTHLAGGMSPSGKRVLSTESTTLMQQVWHDMATPNIPPMGLGWVRYPRSATRPSSPCRGPRPAAWPSCASYPSTNWSSPLSATPRERSCCRTKSCSGS
jgi:CubicO group peptidase (beta-lactamase class C family)